MKIGANGVGHDRIADIVASSVNAYRSGMARFGEAPTLDVWHADLEVNQLIQALPKKSDRRRTTKAAAKARSKTSLKAASKLTETVDGTTRIATQSPLIVPLRELAHDDEESLRKHVEHSWEIYGHSMSDDHRTLLERYRLIDIALKVVGVGSVGTRCLLVLLEGRDANDPLLLQVKEAEGSVLETHLAPSLYAEPGRRVVEGRRLIQASSDIFLGWSTGEAGHHYYWRQFHDMKGSADIATMSPRRLGLYARLCAWTLAHAHARSGDSIAITGYLGKAASSIEPSPTSHSPTPTRTTTTTRPSPTRSTRAGSTLPTDDASTGHHTGAPSATPAPRVLCRTPS